MTIRDLARLPISAAAALALPGVLQAEPFVFVALPDTQVYAENRIPDGRTPAVTDTRGTGAIFVDQVQWILDHVDSRRIRYVAHLGDIVQDGNNVGEWERAKAAMDPLLQADLPHGTVMGNHDDTNEHGPDYRKYYLDYFGPQVFEERSWYTASSPSGGANFQLLEHEGRQFGFLNFSIDQPQSEIDWANQVVESHPDAAFIIGTHRYLYDFKVGGGRYGESADFGRFGEMVVEESPVPGAVDPNSGQELFEKLVTQHPNILMIHCGHFHSEWLRLDGVNSQARTVIEILTDYQSTRNGGDGWLRIYELDFEGDKFRFETYSPTLDRMRTTIDHYVEMIHLAWEQRGQIMDLLGLEDEAVYITLLKALLGDRDAPDGFLLQHPDFDEQAERDYFEKYLDELFLGSPPEGFDDILEWEGLWLDAFAADPEDPFDFSDWVRSPRGELDIEYAPYFAPEPSRAVGLLTALATLASLSWRSRRVLHGRRGPYST